MHHLLFVSFVATNCEGALTIPAFAMLHQFAGCERPVDLCEAIDMPHGRHRGGVLGQPLGVCEFGRGLHDRIAVTQHTNASSSVHSGVKSCAIASMDYWGQAKYVEASLATRCVSLLPRPRQDLAARVAALAI